MSNKRVVTPYGAQARDRYNLPRAVLASFAPDPHRVLDDKNLRTLIAWLITRYDRVAFPDEFQCRLDPIKDKLKKAFDNLHEVTEVFISLDTWEELAEGSDYSIQLVFVMPAENYENVELRKKAEENMLKIAGLLEQCKGIMPADEPILRSDDDFTLHDARRMRRWGDFDYLSYRDQGKHLLPGC